MTSSSMSETATYPVIRPARSRLASLSRLRRWMYASRVRGSTTRPYGKRSAVGFTPMGLRRLCRRMLLELGFDVRPRHRADDLIDDAPALEEEQRRNRAHIEARPGLDVRVDVQLGDLHLALILGRELIQNRRDYAARSAPGRPKVDNRQAVVLLDFLLEIVVRDGNDVRHGTPLCVGYSVVRHDDSVHAMDLDTDARPAVSVPCSLITWKRLPLGPQARRLPTSASP